MKKFRVTIDFDASAYLDVQAETAEEAEAEALRIAREDPMFCIRATGWIGDERVYDDATEELEDE